MLFSPGLYKQVEMQKQVFFLFVIKILQYSRKYRMSWSWQHWIMNSIRSVQHSLLCIIATYAIT